MGTGGTSGLDCVDDDGDGGGMKGVAGMKPKGAPLNGVALEGVPLKDMVLKGVPLSRVAVEGVPLKDIGGGGYHAVDQGIPGGGWTVKKKSRVGAHRNVTTATSAWTRTWPGTADTVTRLDVTHLLLPWWVGIGICSCSHTPQICQPVLHLPHEPFTKTSHLSRQFLLLVDARTMRELLFLIVFECTINDSSCE